MGQRLQKINVSPIRILLLGLIVQVVILYSGLPMLILADFLANSPTPLYPHGAILMWSFSVVLSVLILLNFPRKINFHKNQRLLLVLVASLTIWGLICSVISEPFILRYFDINHGGFIIILTNNILLLFVGVITMVMYFFACKKEHI